MFEALKTDGYVHLEDVFKAFLDDFEFDLEKLSAESLAENVFMTEHGLKQIQNLHERPEFKRLAMALGTISGIRGKVLNMQVFIKYPNYKITSPHQDGAYFEAPERDIYTFWVPLYDVAPENSCMHYLPGSHLRGLLPHEKIGTTVRDRTGKRGYSLCSTEYPIDQYVPVAMKRGDVLIHHQLCMHYSNMNTSDRPRIALTCIMEMDENAKRHNELLAEKIELRDRFDQIDRELAVIERDQKYEQNMRWVGRYFKENQRHNPDYHMVYFVWGLDEKADLKVIEYSYWENQDTHFSIEHCGHFNHNLDMEFEPTFHEIDREEFNKVRREVENRVMNALLCTPRRTIVEVLS